MIVACPQCKTKYNLPDDKAKPELKLRCTVCKKVFTMAESLAAQEQENGDLELAALEKIKAQKQAERDMLELGAPAPSENTSINLGTDKRRQKKWPLVLAILFVVLCIAVGIIWNKTTLLNPVRTMFGFPAIISEEERAAIWEAERQANLEALVGKIGFRNLRQYEIANEKVGEGGKPGRLIVVEGEVTNGFDEPRDFIKVEVTLFDAEGKSLLVKQQRAGTRVSLFQLQVLTEAELEQNLTNLIDIANNNTNVLPGGSVPFTIVLYNPPASAANFDIKVVEAFRPKSLSEKDTEN